MAVAELVRPPALAPVEEPDPYTARQFEALAEAYPELRMELTREGELIIMPPTFPKTGICNAKLVTRLGVWCENTNLGECFDSSTVFTLPNGAKRSPDASWIANSRWNVLTDKEQEEFTLICPDFVAELRSKTDRLSGVQKKMREYRDNGAKLGWLIDPKSKRVEVYRPDQDVEVLDNPAFISGETVLPGFTLDMKGILE